MWLRRTVMRIAAEVGGSTDPCEADARLTWTRLSRDALRVVVQPLLPHCQRTSHGGNWGVLGSGRRVATALTEPLGVSSEPFVLKVYGIESAQHPPVSTIAMSADSAEAAA